MRPNDDLSKENFINQPTNNIQNSLNLNNKPKNSSNDRFIPQRKPICNAWAEKSVFESNTKMHDYNKKNSLRRLSNGQDIYN